MTTPRTPRLLDVVGSMMPMSVESAVMQPEHIWHRVEAMLLQHWTKATTACVIAVHGAIRGHLVAGEGWLTFQVVQALIDKRIPVCQMFTLAVLEQRWDKH
jgi:hypothetical protein